MVDFSLRQLGKIVYDNCGLDYQSNLGSLETKVAKRLQELSVTTWEYIRYLERNELEWDLLIQQLTINETYFYREEKQLRVFQELVGQLSKKEKGPIRIWSAACSTGEEPYSLAMLIDELGLFVEGEVEIIATDIDKRVLQTARNGAYGKHSLSFRRIPSEWLSTYFEEHEREFVVKDSIRKFVRFKHLNLLDKTAMNAENGYDIIFCRNVLIYFDQPTIQKVVTHYYKALNQTGHLFLGHSENISSMGTGFETVSTSSTFYYRKG